MRANSLLHERHLLEAIRRGVITHGQAEALLAIARTEPGGAGRLPDVGWLGLAQGAVVLGAAFAACVANMDHAWRTPPELEVGRALLVGGGLFAAGFALRRYRWAEVPAAVALGAAAMQLVGVGHGALRSRFEYGDNNGMLLGFALMTAAGLAIWRGLRAGPALAATAAGVVGLSLAATRELSGWRSFERESAAFFAAGVALLAWSALQDRAQERAPVDGAFWTHAAGSVSLLCAGAIFIDREAWGFFPFLALALGVGWLGMALRRRVLLAGAGFALFALPPYALAEAHAASEVVAAAFFASALGVLALGHALRRALLSRATDAAEDERSVWL